MSCITLRGLNRKKMKGIIGKKIGMTSIFDPGGRQTACTIIEAGPCVVTQVKTKDSDGYSAIQLAFGVFEREIKMARTLRAKIRHFTRHPDLSHLLFQQSFHVHRDF